MKRIINILLIVPMLLFIRCSSTNVINDYFGIQMNLNESDYFNIVAYTEFSGISYQSTANMNPDIFAWAGLEEDVLRIKLVNNSDNKLVLSYDSDQFIIVNQDYGEFLCIKENIIKYSDYSPISPKTSVELVLKLPQDFWDTIGMKNYESSNKNYSYDTWRGQNTLLFYKEEIKYIRINIGVTTNILLKQVPKEKF